MMHLAMSRMASLWEVTGNGVCIPRVGVDRPRGAEDAWTASMTALVDRRGKNPE